MVIVFFFSSRRRHTRCSRDWSSDVCSSDLVSCSKPAASGAKHEADDVVPVTVAPVEVVSMDRWLDIWGTLYAKDEATLGAEVEGKVEKTLVDFGDRVKTGEELALIDTTTYDALAHQAEANLAKAKATADNAELNLKRAQELRKSNIASQSDLDSAVAAAEQARAEVKADEAANAVARLNLQRSHVKAPFDAAIAERIANAGDYLKAGAPRAHAGRAAGRGHHVRWCDPGFRGRKKRGRAQSPGRGGTGQRWPPAGFLWAETRRGCRHQRLEQTS